ncbi:cytochrome P450 [Spongiibacter sp. KMU-158]|uniref:Cytochrome P450 n=1 Tax=Spongiibacter pelagi TaxID=2760804 RepID=A0A927C2W7_9GAMM|nr:cytochrome P450 [Spongiibacter pelagi]MBD2858786.1 cytochrome P450 [Spongiibacter pelagi]
MEQATYNNKPTISDALSAYDLGAIRKYQRNLSAPDLAHVPGDYGMPFLGHTYWFLTNLHGWLETQYQKHGPVFKMKDPRGEMVLLLGPQANELVFQNDNKVFSNFLAWDQAFDQLFDNNLLERDFSDHKVQRKILQQAFKRQAIEGHMGLMEPLLRNGISKLQSGREIKAMDFVKSLLLNTGAQVFLGMEVGGKADKLNAAFERVVAGTIDPIRSKALWFSPFARGVRARAYLSNYILQAIPARRSGAGQDFFSQFCQMKDEQGKFFSAEEVRDHILFLLFAAHDTTTSALSSTLYSLAAHPEWQEALREEINALNIESLGFDDVDKLEKMGLVLQESLRMYPPLSMMPRFALHDFEFNGYRIPAGTLVAISSVFTHYMKEYWSQPETFDPYRFSPERAEQKGHFYQYIPFGGGSHKCLGLHFAQIQAKMFLFHLLKNFRVEKNKKMTLYKYNNVPLTFPSDRLPLSFTRLN